MFIDREIISNCGWQAFERLIARLLIHQGFKGVRVVGGSGDKGADIIAIGQNNKRWLIQAKYWAKAVPELELQKTLEAARLYKASNSVIVALNGVDNQARAFQKQMLLQGKSLTVWEPTNLIDQANQLPHFPNVRPPQGDYQSAAINSIYEMLSTGSPRKAMIIMATGLGKTFTSIVVPSFWTAN
jgi:predicted helicase